jgi:hypothetical protein
MRLVANPIKLANVAERYAPPPRLGEHNAQYIAHGPDGDAPV